MHEVLVHAASVTTFAADQRYHRQSIACLDFSAAVRHSLSDVEDNTPQGQIVAKPVTPSTTTTDRSDVVPDSQRIRRKRPERSNDESFIDGQTRRRDADLTSDHNTSVTLRSAFETSRRQWLEHQRSFRAPSASETYPALLGLDVHCRSDEVLDHRKVATPHQEADHKLLQRTTTIAIQDETTIYPTPSAFKEPDQSVASISTAKEALAFRESLALKRRRTSYRGLTQVFQISPAIAMQSDSLASNESGNHSISVNKYLTVASREVYGSTVSPVSDGHTSLPSDRTGRTLIEPDIATGLSHSESLRLRNSHSPLKNHSNDSARGKADTYTTQPSSFVVAQLQSPFYRPTLALTQSDDLSQALSPIGPTTLQHLQQSTPVQAQLNKSIPPSVQQTRTVPDMVPSTILKLKPPTKVFIDSTAIDDLHIRETNGNTPSSPVRQSSVVSETFIAALNQSSDPAISSQAPLSTSSPNRVPLRHSTYRNFSSCVPTEYAANDQVFHLVTKKVDSETTTISEFLRTLKTPKKFKLKVREVSWLERGYWLINLQALKFTSTEARHLWKTLTGIITRRRLLWVSLQFHANQYRLYCFGHDVLPVWTVIYAANRKVKHRIGWHDATGEKIMVI